MTPPTPLVRATVLTRDNHQCVSCGATTGLEFRPRQAPGKGRRPAPTTAEGITLCIFCNDQFGDENDNRALTAGWSVPRPMKSALLDRIPVWYGHLGGVGGWCLIDHLGGRQRIDPGYAVILMEAIYGSSWEHWASR